MPGEATPAAAPITGTADTSTTTPQTPPKMSFRDLDGAAEEQTATELDAVVKDIKSTGDEDDDDDLDLDDDEEDGEEQAEETSDEDDADSDEDEDSEEEELDQETDQEEKKAEGEEQIHEVKVNGKVKKLTLEQMKNLVSSGMHTLETYQQFEQEKAAADTELKKKREFLDFANEKITPAWTALEKGDIETALLHLASVKGTSKLEVRRKLREAMVPVIGARLGLSPQEIQQRLTANQPRNSVWDTQEENDFLKSERETALKEQPKAQAPDPKQDAEAQLKAFQAKNGVSDWEVRHGVKWLLDHGTKEADLSIDSVWNVVQQRRIIDRAFDAVRSVKPSLEKDEKFIDRVVSKLKNNPSWTIPDVARWVRKDLKKAASKKAQNLEGTALKLAKDIGGKVLNSGAKSRLENPSSQPRKLMSFRDYESASEGLE